MIFSANDHKAQETENFDWIMGEWIRINGKVGITTTEKWDKISDTVYFGVGMTKKDNQIIFRENLRLLKKNNNWVYEVTGVNEDTTNFILTSISDVSFKAMNPENPFPKKISYHAKNTNLIAEISDENKKITFEFEKKDQK